MPSAFDTPAAHTSHPIHYSRGVDQYDNAPAQRSANDFDEFEAKVLTDRSARKGLTFIGAPLACGDHYQDRHRFPGRAHWRLRQHVEPRRFLAFDFDGFASTASFDATLAYLQRFRGFGYTTASHTAQAPRARAILELNRPACRDEAIALGTALQAAMLNLLGSGAVTFDPTVYRGEQPVFTPVTSSEVFHFAGAAVDVDAWLAPLPPVSAAPPASDAASVEAINSDLTGRIFLLPDKVVDGEGRENTLLQYAGYLRAKGLDQATIERTLLDYNQLHVQPPLEDAVVLDRARRYSKPDRPRPADGSAWPEPARLADSLPKVSRFPLQLLPKGVADYVQDVAARMSCPLDFPAIGATVALAAAVGSRIHCKPEPNGNWRVPAGAWGMVVSPPGAIKSPPLSEMLKPLARLDRLAAQQYAKTLERYQIDQQIYDNALKVGIKAGAVPAGLVAPTEPAMTRYLVNDSTYEMLVAIAAANPNGFLIWRDELVGWFHSLNKESQKEARGLYLVGWSGTESYATDRIGRGHVRADRVNLSLLGTIQPNVLRQIVYDAVAGGAGDDGLVQRLQLAVYPDPLPSYVKVDRQPDYAAKRHYESLIERLAALDPQAVGASHDDEGFAFLTFDEAAQAIFDDWRMALEMRLLPTDTDEHPAMLAHLGKYRSLFPKLALVLHLAAGQTGPIGENAARRAKAWTQYLEQHARRIYHTATNRAMQSAVALANKIKAGKLPDGFTRSDVLVKEWASLRTADEVGTALTVLRDGNWLVIVEDRATGGRPAERHYISPRVNRAG